MQKEQLSEFIKEGYVKIKATNEFKSYVKSLREPIRKILPEFNKSRLPSNEHTLLGTPLSQRLNNCLDMPDELKNPNPLYGKRVIINVYDLPNSIMPLFEHPYVLEHARAALGTENIVLHNGSLAGSYPGNTGNDEQYHSDTRNYCDPKTSLQCLYQNRHLINVMILLDDVGEELAPTSLLTGTHTMERYTQINSVVSKRLGLNENQDNVNQPNWIYRELLDGFEFKEVLYNGKTGDLAVHNSFILHRATENFSNQNVRRVAIFNYGRLQDKCFYRNYPLQKSKRLISMQENKEVTKLTFKKSASTIYHIKERIRKYPTILYEFINRQINRIINPKFVFAKLSLKINQIVISIIPTKREYVNVGCGPVWTHPKFYSLDCGIVNNANEGKISFDLVDDLPLPFSSQEIKGVYTSHCLEHLTEKQVLEVLKDIFRVLHPGGTLRIVLPDMKRMFDAYEDRDATFFNSFKVKEKSHQIWRFDSWLRLVTRSFAGHVVDLYTDTELYNLYRNSGRKAFVDEILTAGESVSDVRNHPNVHKSFWYAEKMMHHLKSIGFNKIAEVERGITSDNAFKSAALFDITQPNTSFFIEAIK